MKKSRFITYSVVLLASMLVMGCNTADREVDKIGKIINPEDNNSIPNNGGSFINDVDDNDTGGNVANDDDNATTGTIKIDAKNAYKVSVKFSEDYNQKGYYSKDDIGEISFDITNIYTNEPADTTIIDSITLEVEEQNSPTDGKYLNFITYSGEQGPKYQIPKDSVKASDSVAIKMKELSGTTNIILTSSIKLKNEETTSDYKLKIPIVIEKNKSSSMAIVRTGSRYENGLFIDSFVLHVVDSYGNRAKDGTRISTGVINNPKLYSNAYNGATQEVADNYSININIPENIFETQTYTTTLLDDQTLPTNPRNNRIIGYDYGQYNVYLTTSKVVETNETNETIFTTTLSTRYYPNIFGVNSKDDRGNLNRSNGTFTLPAGSIDTTKDTITELDTLIVLANNENHKPVNLGGFDIKSINSDNELSLVSLDSGDDITDVSYVIGDEYRYIEYGQTLINAAASTFETTEVKDGLAFAELRYVPEMVGKNVFIYANTRLEDKHIGISRKILLFGTGLGSATLSCTNTEGRRPDCSQSLFIGQNDSGEGLHRANIGQPRISGAAVFNHTTASQTSDTGWTRVSIYGIDENKTATVTVGGFLNNEYIINK